MWNCEIQFQQLYRSSQPSSPKKCEFGYHCSNPLCIFSHPLTGNVTGHYVSPIYAWFEKNYNTQPVEELAFELIKLPNFVVRKKKVGTEEYYHAIHEQYQDGCYRLLQDKLGRNSTPSAYLLFKDERHYEPLLRRLAVLVIMKILINRKKLKYLNKDTYKYIKNDRVISELAERFKDMDLSSVEGSQGSSSSDPLLSKEEEVNEVAERLLTDLTEEVAKDATIIKQKREAIENLFGDEFYKALSCPISLEPIEDPVVAADGVTYERNYINDWFERENLTAPYSNVELTDFTLHPNNFYKLVKKAVIDYVKEI